MSREVNAQPASSHSFRFRAFRFRGRIPASKSILNRLLILRSFEPGLTIDGDSHSDDVVKMKSALASLLGDGQGRGVGGVGVPHESGGEVADCGSAGTTLRFLALRASRIPGTHHLSGSRRLFERPQNELVHLMRQLGCEAELGPQRITIRGEGWKIPEEGLIIDRSVSSQFASGVLLSAWDLPVPLRMRFAGDIVSESYFAMTVELVRRAGLRMTRPSSAELVVEPRSRLVSQTIIAESDLSSAFSVAALAAVAGRAEFESYPARSLQPDGVFAEMFQRMGCRVEFIEADGVLVVERPDGNLRPIDWDLRESPDLFPVLSVVCAFAEGRSRLHGAPHLAHKESNRIEKSAELIRIMGRESHAIEGGLEIEGRAPTDRDDASRESIHVSVPVSAPVSIPVGVPVNAPVYDTDHDHRLAMAAAVARAGGVAIRILHPVVVTKSFPEFFDIAGGAERVP